MADQMPNFIVLRSTGSRPRCVRYVKDDEQWRGYLKVGVENVHDPLCKIQVERSKTDSRCIHLQFVHVNKYWAKPANNHFLIAAPDQPEEDLSKATCTLIRPTFQSNNQLVLFHAQSGRGIERDTSSATIDFLMANSVVAFFSFTIIDWDTLVIIPRHVAFKGLNDRYAGGLLMSGANYLQLSETDPDDNNLGYEIQQMPDGHVRIKSICFDRY